MLPVPDLNWPATLFSLPYLNEASNTTAPLFAGAGKKTLGDHLCACGCKLPHKTAVSGLEGNHGHRRVLWFATMRCKSKYLGLVSC
jgi:hypothetical protein